MRNLQLPQQYLNMENVKRKYPYMKNLPISSYTKARPTILIGLSHSYLLVPFEKRMGKPNEPVALKTKLGWFVFGNITTSNENGHIMMIQQATL